MKTFRIGLITCLILYTIALAGVFAFQRSFIYFPPAGDDVRAIAANIDPAFAKEKRAFEIHEVVLRDGSKIAFTYLPPKGKAPIIVAALGNAHSNHTRQFYTDYFGNQGFGVLVLGYPGFGGNQGAPSEQAIYEAARLQIEWLTSQNIAFSHIALFGQSLGSGVATELATDFPFGCLVLESPFTSAPDMAALRFPIFPARFLIWDKYDNLSKIRSIRMPTLIYQGGHDSTIPQSMGRAIFAASPSVAKQSMWIENAEHNNLADFVYNGKKVLDNVTDFIRANTN